MTVGARCLEVQRNVNIDPTTTGNNDDHSNSTDCSSTNSTYFADAPGATTTRTKAAAIKQKRNKINHNSSTISATEQEREQQKQYKQEQEQQQQRRGTEQQHWPPKTTPRKARFLTDLPGEGESDGHPDRQGHHQLGRVRHVAAGRSPHLQSKEKRQREGFDRVREVQRLWSTYERDSAVPMWSQCGFASTPSFKTHREWFTPNYSFEQVPTPDVPQSNEGILALNRLFPVAASI